MLTYDLMGVFMCPVGLLRIILGGRQYPKRLTNDLLKQETLPARRSYPCFTLFFLFLDCLWANCLMIQVFAG